MTPFTCALSDFVRPQRVAVWLLVTFVVGFIGSVWVRLVPGMSQPEAFGQIVPVLVFRVTALASAVFATMVLSQEVEQKTVTYLLTRPIARWQLLLARMLAALVVVVSIGVLAEVAAAVTVVGPGALGSRAFWMDLLLHGLGAFVYIGLFTFLSLIIAKSMIWSLLFAFGWETFVPNMPGDMYYLSVMTYLRSLSLHPQPETDPSLLTVLAGSMSPQTAAPAVSWVALIGSGAFLWALCAWWFSRYEYSPREDAD